MVRCTFADPSWWSTTSRRSARSSRPTCSARATRRASPPTAPPRWTRSPSARPDLIVLDLMLPGIDGLEVMRRVRERPDRTSAIILLTAKGGESDRVIGLRLGADDYVVKPFSPAELVARVDAVLRRVDHVAARRAGAGLRRPRDRPVARARVRRDGEPVQLTAREFDLLLFLARHPRPGVHARAADGPRLAVRVLHRHLDGDGAHPPAAGQARGRPGDSRAGSRRYGASDTASLPELRARPGAGAQRRRAGRLRLARRLDHVRDRRAHRRADRARGRVDRDHPAGGLRRHFAAIAALGVLALRPRSWPVRRR